MTPLQIILLSMTMIMVIRQVALIGTLAGLVSKYGRARILWTWWAHLLITVGLVVCTVVSFTGIRS